MKSFLKKAVYTIQGKKDPRLQATFLASYISTSTSEECTYRNKSTATRKVRVGSKSYPVTEDNYRIEIPIYLKENESSCGYRFNRIELLLRRLYDNDLYSRHMVLNVKSEARAIYFGDKGGFSGQASQVMPAKIITDKKYFRVAKKSQYICRTKYYSWKNSSVFYCLMRIGDGKNENQFIPLNKPKTVVTHPELGVDKIKSDILNIDIFADDQGSKSYTGKETLQDYFRELPAPKPNMAIRFYNHIRQLFE